ncbi:hypothetical protein CIC12_08775 [Burkholderia sp. SG-MS1]|uniref:hypothetical protein n=1 Tax=Paraburkholderia sp. SG-MS1 TaxID=2023741 RepID=UPI0014465E9F|nr:hypothetical protein [Paraburkholderia sp. SG-MS1]NKJ46830.1 hypothetical protein [Paraburkholderia sp. SG-MS1]
MKESTMMTFDELSALRSNVNADVAKGRKEIDALAERMRKANAALTKALADATPDPIPADEGERLEGMMRDLKAARTVEIGAAHADGRKPVTAKLDKAINQAENDLAAYLAKREAAEAGEPVFEEKRAEARAKHASEVKEINAAVAKVKYAIARLEWQLMEGYMRCGINAALAATTDEMAADRLLSACEASNDKAVAMGRMFEGTALAPLARHFDRDNLTLRRDAEMKRLAASGLKDLPKPFHIRTALNGYYDGPSVREAQQGPRVIESEPTDHRERRYANAGVFLGDGRRIG